MDSKIIAFAIEAHQNVNHLYDGKPYSVHLSMVAINAVTFIDCIPTEVREEVLAACWLHDTIEDCRLTYNDIKKIAGEAVAEIVYAVTNDKGRNRKERAGDAYYAGIRKTPWATYVKLCDRLANIQYSYENMSAMYGVYQKEHEAFLNALFPGKTNKVHYEDIISEMNWMVRLNSLD